MNYLNVRKKSTLGAASLVQKHPRRRLLRRVLVILLAILLLVAAVIGGIGVYFSNAILEVIHYTPTYNLAVTAVSAKTMTLQRTSNTLTPGEFEIEWPAGQAIVGPIISSNASTVTRQLLQTNGPLSWHVDLLDQDSLFGQAQRQPGIDDQRCASP